MIFIIFLLLMVSPSFCVICNRTPPNADKPKPNLDRYVIEITGNPVTYSPGQTYTIQLKTSPSNPVTNTFSEFMLVVEPKSALEFSQNTVTGDLAPLDYTIARFTPRCPNAIIQTNNLAKSSVEIAWTAPISGNGCIAIRATVFESSDSWFSDNDGLTKIICEEEENKNIQSPVLEICAACNEAKYEIAFQGLWTRNTHPKDYPANMWMTKLGEVIGASHKYTKSFWAYYDTASDGLKDLAEQGNTLILEDELKKMVQNDDIRTIIKARELSYPNITGTSYTVFRVDQAHHLVSIVSKITPSPDWIVGVANLELCTPDGNWILSRTLNLYPWDVGTDDGKSYNSIDSPSMATQDIKPITSNVRDSPFYDDSGEPIKPIAQLRVTRQKLYTKSCEKLDAEENEACKLTEWSQWSSCSSTCGNEVLTRDRQFVNPDNQEECTKDGPIELQETARCKGEAECETSDCANAEWSEWTACSTTCGVGAKTRTGNRTNNEEEQQNEEACEESVDCYMPECEENLTTTEIPAWTAQSQVLEGPSYLPKVDCEVSEWSDWGPCTATEPCTKGRQYKDRHIIVHPQNGGKACPKLRNPKRCRVPCHSRHKPNRKPHGTSVDCQMGAWSQWSPCSSNCGSTAVQQRTRTIEVYPKNGGRSCGPRIEDKRCSLPYACSDRESFDLNKYLK